MQGISQDSREMKNKREEKAPPQPSQMSGPIGPLNDNTALDLSRKTGDWQVYKYWIRSLGGSSVILFTILLVLLVFFWKFPGIISAQVLWHRLTVCEELWVKFWTSSVTKNGDRVNAFYMSVFTVLAVGCLVSLLGVTW